MVAHGPAHGSSETPAHGSDGPLLARDRAILVQLGKMRLLSLGQLGALIFGGRHRSRLSYRIQALARHGWIRTWEDRSVRGGRPRYVVPTRAGLRFALRALDHSHATLQAGTLLRTMLKGDRQLPIPLRDGVTPPFLAHLREANDLLAAIALCPSLHLTWASSWHRPFPNSLHGLRLPQPDFIAVIEVGGERTLLFGEHDRGHEPLGRFAEAKVHRYRALADRPDLLRALTSFDMFRVAVTVRDVLHGDDLARGAALARTAHEGFASRFITVVRASDLLASPDTLLGSAF